MAKNKHSKPIPPPMTAARLIAQTRPHVRQTEAEIGYGHLRDLLGAMLEYHLSNIEYRDAPDPQSMVARALASAVVLLEARTGSAYVGGQVGHG